MIVNSWERTLPLQRLRNKMTKSSLMFLQRRRIISTNLFESFPAAKAWFGGPNSPKYTKFC